MSTMISSDLAAPQWDCAPIVSREGDRTVLLLGGECDIATAGAVIDALTQALFLDTGDLIVDMSAVTFIGIITIDALILTRDALMRQSRCLTVRSPSRCVRRLLTVCGHADLIEPA